MTIRKCAPRDPLEQLNLMADMAGVGLWSWNLDGDELSVDQRSAELCGLPGTQVLTGARGVFARVVLPADLSAFHAAAAAAARGESPAPQRLSVVAADGGIHPQEMKFRLDAGAAGTAARVLVMTSPCAPAAGNATHAAKDALIDMLSIATQAAGIYVWKFDWLAGQISWDENRLGTVPGNRNFGHEFGTDLFKRMHPEDRHVGKTAMRAALARGEADCSFRYRLQLEDGSIRHVQAFARNSTDAAGELLHSLGVSWDVTREAEAAQQLEDAQRRLERASLSIQEGHWELDLLTNQHWASSSYCTLLGVPTDGATVANVAQVFELMHPEDRERADVAAKKHLETGILHDIQVRFAVRDGSYRWFRVRARAERDADGRAIRLSGSIHDVHQQRLTEEALREAQSRFTRAIHGTQDGLWEFDIRKDHLWLSPRLHELLGFADGELPGDGNVLRQRIHPEDLALADAALVQNFKGAPLDIEVRMRTKSGDYRWFRMRALAASETSGEVERVSGSMQDAHAAHEAQAALIRASDEAKAANRAKSAFLANVSHEIRTPMNGIIGMTSLLLDTELDPAQLDCADTIRASAESLLAVINDLLDFSKIEAGKLDIESIEMDLPATVEDIGAIMALQAAAKGLELIINVHPDVPLHVLGDPQRIRQCIINLLGNAIKFTHTGEIACNVSVVNGRSDSDSDRVHTRFEVRDTGIGVAAGALPTLFQPFVQADSSTTRHFGGTGLGLSIVRRLVEMMGGQAGVESTLGEGSVFWFELPMIRLVGEAQSLPATPNRRSMRVLVVDDNETNRRVLTIQLSHAGYQVVSASGAVEALVILQAAVANLRPFDIVIADFQMPGMDGAMLGERINGDVHLSQTRVVLLTSMDRHGDLDRFAAMGFAGYLSKPVRPRELLACLDRVLARDAHEWHTQTQPIVTSNAAHQFSKIPRFHGAVLLVEDNAVNQKVASRFLERLGCEVTVAENGAVGVQEYQRRSFKLVLMDVNMPVMDGYAASRRIRELEQGGTRVPIVALTANAMTGQLERCQDAEMDGLLTKPIDVQRLEEVLKRFGLATDATTLLEGAPPVHATAAAAAGPKRAAVDLDKLREMTDGDPAFTADLVAAFVSSGRTLLADLHSHAASGASRQLAGTAHQLKGASANMQAAPLRELCSELENGVLGFDSLELEQRIDAIATEFKSACAELEDLVANSLGLPVRHAGT